MNDPNNDIRDAIRNPGQNYAGPLGSAPGRGEPPERAQVHEMATLFLRGEFKELSSRFALMGPQYAGFVTISIFGWLGSNYGEDEDPEGTAFRFREWLVGR